MRKLASVSLLAVLVLLLAAAPSDAFQRTWHRHHAGFRTHVFVGVGPAFWWGPAYPYWWYPPPPYYVYSPPPVIVQEPPVYVQQPPAAPAPTPPAQPSYWYYCQSAGAYYPSVQTCPEAWIKVPPR